MRPQPVSTHIGLIVVAPIWDAELAKLYGTAVPTIHMYVLDVQLNDYEQPFMAALVVGTTPDVLWSARDVAPNRCWLFRVASSLD